MPEVLSSSQVGLLEHAPYSESSEEWLVTNGLGGYASGTVSGAMTRRYHGLLIAALPNPLGRTTMLNGLSERLRLPEAWQKIARRTNRLESGKFDEYWEAIAVSSWRQSRAAEIGGAMEIKN